MTVTKETLVITQDDLCMNLSYQLTPIIPDKSDREVLVRRGHMLAVSGSTADSDTVPYLKLWLLVNF